MWTVEYRGFYIHGYTNKDECKVMIPVNAIVAKWHHFKSYRAAQLAITRHIKENVK